MIRVLLAEDDELARSALVTTLNADPDIQVVIQAADGLEALYLCDPDAVDVCVVDVRMPGIDGVELARRWAGPELDKRLAVLILTTFDEPSITVQALQSGAIGFLLKDAGPTLLIEGVKAAARGESIISPAVASRILTKFQYQGAESRRPTRPLTPREKEVLALVAKGATNKGIAQTLFMSVSTVKLHLASLRAKLDLKNRTELAAWAHDAGESERL